MAITSDDRRFKRTKKMIRNAFSKLVEDKGFSEITITDITQEADINRGTFYLHYSDKYDLLEKIENEVIAELDEQTKNEGYMYFLNLDCINKPAPFLVKLFDYFVENISFMKAILGPKGNPIFQIKLKRLIETHMFEEKENHFKKANMLIPEEYFVSYILSAHLGVIQQWIENGMKETPEEMALILTRMFYFGPMKVGGLQSKNEL